MEKPTEPINRAVVLVASPDDRLAEYLATAAGSLPIRLVACAVEQDFYESVRSSRPEVAVLDLAYGHNATKLMIAVLRDVSPRVRIIALSRDPSIEDGRVVEQGLFYYLTGPEGPPLVQVLHAALQAVAREHA